MTERPLALTVEQGLHAEQELLAAVCRGERDAGVLFWRPTDHALVMPRRMSRLTTSRPPALSWPLPGGLCSCAKRAASRCLSPIRQ